MALVRFDEASPIAGDCGIPENKEKFLIHRNFVPFSYDLYLIFIRLKLTIRDNKRKPAITEFAVYLYICLLKSKV